MKRKATLFFLIAALTFNTACYGPFNLTKKLYDWNGTVGDKFTNALVFFAFLVIPVYDVTLLVDGLVLNTIEFWTGDNPVAMNENESDIQVVSKDGNTYQITATKNKFHIVQLEGINKGEKAEFIFNAEEETWYLHANGKKTKLVDFDPQKNSMEVFLPNGKSVSFNADITDKSMVQHSLENQYSQYSLNK